MNNNNRGNSNNSNNNRRRGRGSRPQGSGGGQQLNRVDSRARGNAPQLLEKYRKLAQDAHLNGDRVTAEYYLQFADHYFRVLADQRVRQDEQRVRRDDRSPENGDEGEENGDNGEFNMESDFPSFEQPGSYTRRDREDRPRREDRPERQEQSARQEQNPRRATAGRDDRSEPGDGRTADASSDDTGGADEPAAANPYEPPENPFVRESRGTRGLKPRRAPRPAQDDRAQGEQDHRPRRDTRGDDDAPIGLDPASLPPAISIPRDPVDEAVAEEKPRRRAPRRKPAADGAGETLESVS